MSFASVRRDGLCCLNFEEILGADSFSSLVLTVSAFVTCGNTDCSGNTFFCFASSVKHNEIIIIFIKNSAKYGHPRHIATM